MEKICFPHHTQGEFASLKEAVHKLKKMEYGWSSFTLAEIVRYNICYRDHLRQFGIKSLADRLIGESVELKDDKAALNYLYEWWQREQYVAAYDIQCYNVENEITVFDHTFHGLKDIVRHRGIIGKEFFSGFECFIPEKTDECPDIHIGEIYQNYPIFDSYDLSDDRTYQNYIFRNKAISEDDMRETFRIPYASNFCMVHENIPQEQLPILYYSGDGKYMLLATSKK